MILALLAGCSDRISPTAPAEAPDDASIIATEEIPTLGNIFWVCTDGSDGKFLVTVDDGEPMRIAVADGHCVWVHKWNGKGVNYVTVTELPSGEFVLDRIVLTLIDGNSIVGLQVREGTNTVTDFVGGPKSRGAIVMFFNKPSI